MSVLVNVKNEQEEKVLLAFLDSLHYKYQSDIDDESIEKLSVSYIEQYNNEIDQADAEIESGNYVKHQDVEKFFKNRRKTT